MASDKAFSADVLLTTAMQAELRERFFRWQCRVRQSAVRDADGRPSPGMLPKVKARPGGEAIATMNVLIIKPDQETITRFRYIARKTADPKERYDSALRFLAERYFQDTEEFASDLTALCGKHFAVADELIDAGECVLEFEQSTYWFEIPCAVRSTQSSDPLYQATYWHNSLFNPNLSGDVRVLALTPKWQRAASDAT